MNLTIDGALIQIVSDGKHHTFKHIRSAFISVYGGGYVPKSTIWYHLLKLQKENMISTFREGNRVYYVKVEHQ
jgi:hypothetical protein